LDDQLGIVPDQFSAALKDGAVQITTDQGRIFVIDADVETLELIPSDQQSAPTTYNYAALAALAVPPIIGTGASETLIGTNEADNIQGLAGDDWILPSGGRDTVDGGAGNDMVSFAGLGAGIRLFESADGFRTDQPDENTVLTNVERVTGTSQGDIFNANEGSFRGLGGSDSFFAAGTGTAHYDGGAGQDVVSYIETTGQGVTASLFRGKGWEGDARGDTYANIENLIGSQLDDKLWGDNNANILNGLYGDDTLVGAGGDDIIFGGAGRTTAVYSGNIQDYLIKVLDEKPLVVEHLNGGVDGSDYLRGISVLQFADVNVTYGSRRGDVLTVAEGFVYLGSSRDILIASESGTPDGPGIYDGGTDKDILSYENSSEGIYASLQRGRGWEGDAAGDRFDRFEWLRGTDHDDRLDGSRGNDTLEGGAGDDTLTGGFGDDYILAGVGTDTIVFSGERAEYSIVQDGIRTEVTHLNDGTDGFDIIAHAEVLRFADGDVDIILL
jgi:Ca2+-binding RTX toxin-like protein